MKFLPKSQSQLLPSTSPLSNFIQSQFFCAFGIKPNGKNARVYEEVTTSRLSHANTFMRQNQKSVFFLLEGMKCNGTSVL